MNTDKDRKVSIQRKPRAQKSGNFYFFGFISVYLCASVVPIPGFPSE
jgi:hypothetical protein